MYTKIDGVRIDTIIGAYGSNVLDVLDLCVHKLNIDEHQAKRLVKSTGFKSLRQLPYPYTTSDLCVAACKELINKKLLNIDDIGALIFVTQTPDYLIPGTSYCIQNSLGLSSDTLLLDFTQGCSGFVYGLYYASVLIKSKQCSKVLLCVGDTACFESNDRVDNTQAKNHALFGDGAAVAIISSDSQNSISFNINSNGNLFDVVIDPNSGYKAKRVLNDEDISFSNCQINGVKLADYTLDVVSNNIIQLMQKESLSFNDISYCLAHQANKNIISFLCSVLQTDSNKIPFLAQDIGNTSSASIPLLLSNNQNELTDIKNKPTLLCGFGVGMSCASALVNLQDCNILSPVSVG